MKIFFVMEGIFFDGRRWIILYEPSSIVYGLFYLTIIFFVTVDLPGVLMVAK
jgi:hypothetical protein